METAEALLQQSCKDAAGLLEAVQESRAAVRRDLWQLLAILRRDTDLREEDEERSRDASAARSLSLGALMRHDAGEERQRAASVACLGSSRSEDESGPIRGAFRVLRASARDVVRANIEPVQEADAGAAVGMQSFESSSRQSSTRQALGHSALGDVAMRYGVSSLDTITEATEEDRSAAQSLRPSLAGGTYQSDAGAVLAEGCDIHCGQPATSAACGGLPASAARMITHTASSQTTAPSPEEDEDDW
eukprot:TRINITY_DN26070_c0_g1_i2.p1 TRINITY_DN26070_c0_g1~~TRINITY_DN26070_c0_g1_i2.p1  ORF type:complete len:247 (-),score=54.03 TRINITY_DN26070_c0_g1_i2:328-1068(-)